MALIINRVTPAVRALMILNERIEEKSAREQILAEELSAVANERKALEADKKVLEQARAIENRLLNNPGPDDESSGDFGSQSRARIGPQRYAMLATLRLRGRLDMIEIANLTNLPINRVREQMRSDQPTYVIQESLLGAQSDGMKLYLTDAGKELLKRFEAYRISSGKSLPPLVVGDSVADDDDELDPAHSKSGEAGVQGPENTTVKSVEGVVHDNIT